MIRALVFFVVVAVLALGATWLADHPGTVLVTWGGQDYQFSTLVGLLAVLVLAVVLMIAWAIIRFVFNVPAVLSVASRTRRRNRGLKALSRGMVAVGSGDAAAAKRHAAEAGRFMQGDPMTLLLKAQAAQLAGDRDAAQAIFTQMLDTSETRALGLRGLHMEAHRKGNHHAAYMFASEAQKVASLPWAGQAVLQHRAAQRDWAGALAAVERNAGGGLIDRPTANRQRAVLQTAIAQDCAERSPDEAIRLAREALRVAPTLVPAAALAGRLLASRGDLRRAAKIIETAFAETPHPDLAAAYINARVGDSALDRLGRAETLAKRAAGQPESRLIVARAALEAREFDKARQIMAPLINGEEGSRPTARTCLMMADIEEAEHGETGALFEWLQRAARAPHDPAWIADGIISDTWSPVSPASGRIDAFVWETPNEQLSAPEQRRMALPHDQQNGPGTPPEADGPARSIEQSSSAAPSGDSTTPIPERPIAGELPPQVLPTGPVEAAYLPPPVKRQGYRSVVFPLAGAPDDPGPTRSRYGASGPRDGLDFN
ncbi:heme biosynthesis protein HemY [Lichenihabitans sp. PAMC28606]|uniref:heme biosynthesis protein HemY n=1 Tax=Lichenihabitans sp. PAMC28606 TaxID=2880932 RepID=UPI001D09AA22|nr:heme biosynthesis HemY N-terminal domain-containing protein [Lichenihabitans sp. PAMC28606]UDL96459.1 heme biosynthesis protein HemY [Lichenihabitans sp. PAMC28606]